MIRAERLRPLATWAGPILIVGCVLLVLHSFASGGLISTQHIDVMPQWLPTYCFLGKSLAAGHVPAYNPYTLAGTPFAADPQSGWTYLPAMLLFTAFSCDRAIRWFVVLQPILAGLGAYWFLRSEGLSRPAATASGLVLAMVMADSYIALSLPFAGTLAWTALLLAAASRFMRATSWRARFAWAAAVALAWGQLANAHMSNGLFMGTALLGTYLFVRLVADVREGRWTGSLACIGLLVVALPLVNLAVFWPRLSYVHRSSLSLGYLELQRTAAHLAHRHPLPFGVGASSPVNWPLGLTTSPGSYLGAIALGLTFAGWRARRHLGLVIGLAGYGLVTYLLSLQAVAQHFRTDVMHSGPGQLWIHEPARFRYGTLLAITLLVGFGVEAWRHAKSPVERGLLLVPGILVFGLLPPLTHVTHDHTGFVLGMAVGGAAILALTAWRPALLAVIPALLAVELLVNGFIGQGAGYTLSGVGIERPATYIAWAPLRKPNVNAAAYVRPTPISRSLQSVGDRYVPLAFQGFHRERGYLLLQKEKYWGLLANQRGMVFEIRDAQGYNPVQLIRYWTFMRSVDPKYIHYNAAFLSNDASPVAKDLLQIGWTVASTSSQRSSATWTGQSQVRDGDWTLYQLPGGSTLATSFSGWDVVRSPGASLHAVLSPGFDPRRTLVVEDAPSSSPQAPEAETGVGVRSFGPQSTVLDVDANRPQIVLVRVPYDTGWHATVDGKPAEVLHADYVDMGVAVRSGRHTIELGYGDPRIGYGLIGSGVALAILGAGVFVASRRKREPSG